MVSDALLAAQNRLLARRSAIRRIGKAPRSVSAETAAHLPSHIGWGNHQLLRSTIKTASASHSSAHLLTALGNCKPPVKAATFHGEIAVYPDMAAAVLKQNLVAPARAWWAMRLLDSAGSGQLSAETIRTQLTIKGAPLRICGRRQLRKLLRTGDGIFWRWDGKTVWLRSRVKAAAALGVKRFTTAGILLSAETFCQPIAQLKANLYATLHCRPQPTPVARATLTDITGLSASSQRRYEASANIDVCRQIALAPDGDNREAAWRHGRAVFPYVDHQGRHGAIGTRYLARQLPNIYRPKSAPQHCTKRKTRHLNQRLKDLLQLGTAGNGRRGRARRYYANGAAISGEGVFASGRPGIWYAVDENRGARLC